MKTCKKCGDTLPHKYKGCVRKPITVEAETAPENISAEQAVAMIKAMLHDTLRITESVFIKDNAIHISTCLKIFQENNTWQCYHRYNKSKGWQLCYPTGQNSPIDYFSNIMAAMSQKKLNTWLMTNYYCTA